MQGGTRVRGDKAIALIEKAELLWRLEMQLLLQVLARTAAKLVENVVVSLAF
jgi:hypothetical protein